MIDAYNGFDVRGAVTAGLRDWRIDPKRGAPHLLHILWQSRSMHLSLRLEGFGKHR